MNDLWIPLIPVLLAVVAVFALLIFAHPRCYTCHKRATIEVGEYPVCRKCWERIARELNYMKHLDEIGTATEREIREYFEARRDAK